MDTLHKIMDLLWKRDMKEKDFCIAVGINKSAVTDWKNGKTKSYLKHISKIAEVLNVSEDYLLGETDDTSVNSSSDDLNEYLELLRNRDEMKMLFNLTKDATKEEVEKAVDIITAFLKKD